jgi:hypothetical protein
MAWRCSYDDALQPVDWPISSNGPYAICQGALAADCAHEAGHAVAAVSMGKRLDRIEVALNFVRWSDGVYAGPSGRCSIAGAKRDQMDLIPSNIPLVRSRESKYCWRAYIEHAIFACAGPAADLKYRSLDQVRAPKSS